MGDVLCDATAHSQRQSILSVSKESQHMKYGPSDDELNLTLAAFAAAVVHGFK